MAMCLLFKITEGKTVKKSHTFSTHTREQISKLTGVSTANIAKYDVVMKSDDEKLKE